MGSMPKIEEVFDSNELAQILRIEHDVHTLSDIHFMFGVPHIECGRMERGVCIEIQPMWMNPYVLKPNETNGRSIRFGKASYKDLAEKRRQIKERVMGCNDRFSVSARTELVKHEHSLRAEDIKTHKFYLSEVMGYDSGLVVASAHWLKTVGCDFYACSEEHYEELGVPFFWEGMERTIGLSALDRDSRSIMYAVGCSKDFFKEENLAQGYAGFIGDNRACELARTRLQELHNSRYFCVLNNPKKD